MAIMILEKDRPMIVFEPLACIDGKMLHAACAYAALSHIVLVLFRFVAQHRNIVI